MKKFLFLGTILLIFGLVIQPNFVLSENAGGNKTEIETLNQKIAEKKKKVQNLEKSIDAYKKKIQQKRLEGVSLSNQIGIIDNRIAQVELDIEYTEEKIETLELELEALVLSIDTKETVISKRKEIISDFIRLIHQEGSKKFLEILATHENFSDFYNQLQYIETIEKDLGKSTRSLRLAKEELDTKKTQKEERKIAYTELKEELDEKKKDFDDQLNVKGTLLAQTQSSELQFQTLLSGLKKQYQQIEGEITSIEQEVRKKLEVQDKLNGGEVNFDGKLSWPTQSRYVTAYFHDPDYPYRHIFEHNAIDIRAGQGTPIKAAASGYVARAKHCAVWTCYSYIMLVHSGGLSTVYGHMSKINVATDQFVTRGDVIGYSGGTPGTVGAGPFVTGPHLHFEVRKNGIPVDTLSYLVKDY